MNKLQMAHEYAMKHVQEGFDINYDVLVVEAWKYADAMQAEADKREKEEAAQRRKEIREMLNAPNTFVEREGQHFDDFCSDEIQAQRDAELYGTGFLKVTYDSDGVKYKRLDPKTISVCSSNIGLDSQVLKEWQPDWSQAPDWANWWCLSVMHGAMWFSREPICTKSTWAMLNDVKSCAASFDEAPPFYYAGNWQDSLRKRPQ